MEDDFAFTNILNEFLGLFNILAEEDPAYK
jgi:hypothetical protein